MGQKLTTFAGVLTSSFYEILLFYTALTNIFLSLFFLSLSLSIVCRMWAQRRAARSCCGVSRVEDTEKDGYLNMLKSND